MSLLVEVRPRQYHDSIVLMVASARMSAVPGVEAAMAAMATPLNLVLFKEMGLWTEELAQAGDSDLVLAARGPEPEAAFLAAERALTERGTAAGPGPLAPPRTMRTAAGLLEGANLAVVSVPGEHAAWICWDALTQDLNVFCFSDHVTLADEIRLKDEALRRGLLMLGPDCGTAILDGVGLGFSNVVPRGRAGIVGASGTGIQQVSCLLAQQGVGISQAIGVGGRDLTPEVGGRMAREAVRRLDQDPETDVIVVVAKGGSDLAGLEARKPLLTGPDLTDLALEVGGGSLPADPPLPEWNGGVQGIFGGGTLRDEAAAIWGDRPGFNAVDYGDERFTRGRPHPMIDHTLRLDAIRRAEGLVYLDVVLGRGAHPDPAAELAPALAGRPAVVVLVGTDADPQGLSRQRTAFEAAGAAVFTSNSRAARAVLSAGPGS
ncbi:MAG TPA: FdrA family protein [Candidatus Dormibacteraeota bacterium]